MAEGSGQSLERLYIELGLDMSQLQSDFLAADKTVTENLGRLNRERNIIKLRMQADISGLDQTVDATKILEIQEKSLNQQLTVSKDRLAILEAAYKQVAENKNSTAFAVNKAEQALQRERIEVGKLEASLRALASQKISFDTTQLQSNIAKLNAQIQHVKIKAEIDTSQLTGANSAFDAHKIHITAVTRELELQRQKLVQLREAMNQSARNTGGESVATLNIKSNVLQQIQEVNQLEQKLKELSSQTVFVDTSRLQENISRLNAKIQNVRLKAEIDTSQLQASGNVFGEQKARIAAITQELELQRQKLTQLREVMNYSVATTGKDSTQTLTIKSNVLQQEQEINRLQAKLKELSGTDINLRIRAESFKQAEQSVRENVARLNAQIQNIRLMAELDTSKLQDAGNAFDAQKIHIAAVTKELELQRQKLIQLRATMFESAKQNGAGSVQTLNIKSNVLTQIQEIQRLEQKLKELQNTNVDLKIRAENAQKIEQTISDTISRINATVGLIRVKTEVDTSKISGATAEFDKAKRQVTALNQELTLQNRKLAEMQRLLSQSSGTKAINLAADIQRQIQEIDRLKAKIAELSKIKPPKSGGLLGGYVNIKGDISGKLNEISSAFSQLKGATASADSAIISVLGAIDAIPSPVGKAATALAGLPIIFKGIENSIVSMTKAAAASGDAVYVMSRGFQMSFADTGKFTTNAKVAGVEVNDLAGTIKFLQRQIARGGEDNRAAEWLRRYGESAYNASGNLKNLNEMTFALSRALKKTQAEGKGSEFIFNVFRNVSADAITAIEDIEAVSEQASHIVKNGLANPALAHEVQGNLNAMNVQAGQMNAAFESALLPVANEIIPRMTERMGKFTTLIADNKDLILSFGRDLAEVWGAVENAVDKAAEGFEWLAEQARENRVVPKSDTKTVVDRYKDDWSVKSAEDIVNREMENGGYSDEDRQKLIARQDLYRKEIARHNTAMEALWTERRKIFAEDFQDVIDNHIADDSIKTATDLLNRLTDEEKEAIAEAETGFGSMLERCGALNTELQQTRKELGDAAKKANEFKTVSEAVALGAQALGESEEQRKAREKAQKHYDEAAAIRYKTNHSDYENQRYDNYRWLKDELAKDDLSEAERLAIRTQYAAKSEQIEQERADKISEIREKVASEDKTALENKLANIEKERQAWLKAGMEEAEATELAQQRIIKARAEAAEKTQEYLRNAADIEYSLTHTAFEKQMRDIEQWKTAQMKKADTAEEVAAIIANAAAKEAEAFEREVDRIKGKIETLEDKIFKQEHSQYEVDLRNLQKERQELYNEGLPAEMIERYYKNALGELRTKAEKARKDKSDYTKNPKGNSGWGVIDFGQKPPESVSAYQQAIDITSKKYGISADIVTAARERETQAIIDQTQALRGQYEVMEWGNGVINGWGSGGDFNGKSAPYEVIGWGDASNGVIERRDNVQPFNAEKFYQRLPEQLEEIKRGMLEGDIKKWRGNYQTESERYDHLFTFNAQRTAAGMSDEEAQRLLDNIYDEVTRIRQQENTTAPSRAEIGSSESQSVVAGISREVEQRADINRQGGYISTPDTDLLTPLNEMAQTIERQIEDRRPTTQTVTLSPQAISALQSRQSKNQPKITNNITVQVENVNADEIERVNEAADLIADKVREAVNSMGNGMNLSYAS